MYLVVLWAFAPSAVKMMKMFSWFAGAFAICMCFQKLQRFELSRPPYKSIVHFSKNQHDYKYIYYNSSIYNKSIKRHVIDTILPVFGLFRQ